MTTVLTISILLASALMTPKGADVFGAKAVVAPPPAQAKIFMFQFPPGFVKSNYVIELEETAELGSDHWWPGPTGYTTNDIDTNGIVTIRATLPQRFYRLKCTPKNKLPPYAP